MSEDWEFNYVIRDKSRDLGFVIAAYNQDQALDRCVQFQDCKRENLKIVDKYKNDKESILKMIADLSEQSPIAKTINLPNPSKAQRGTKK